MKKLFILSTFILSGCSVEAQNTNGKWVEIKDLPCKANVMNYVANGTFLLTCKDGRIFRYTLY